jgi:hypothetical protein
MKIRKRNKDIIYPVRIPQEVFKQAREIAISLDLSTCQLIRAALRETIRRNEERALANPGFQPRVSIDE